MSDMPTTTIDWQAARGWLSQGEGDKLAELAANKWVLEIGSWCGRSTLAMARTAYRIVAVDWHRGDAHTGEADTLAEFWANITRAGVRDIVTPFVGTVRQWYELAENHAFDFAFIDASHDYDSVSYDIFVACRMCDTKATIAFHDYGGDVMRAAEDAGFKKQGQVGSLAWGTF